MPLFTKQLAFLNHERVVEDKCEWIETLTFENSPQVCALLAYDSAVLPRRTQLGGRVFKKSKHKCAALAPRSAVLA